MTNKRDYLAMAHSREFDNEVDASWASYSFLAGYKARDEEVKKILGKISAHCGHPDAAEGCRLILLAIREHLRKIT